MKTGFSKYAALSGLIAVMTACGGGNDSGGSGSGGGTTTSGYTVGGSVAGLSGTVVLQNNGGDDLSVSSSGRFIFVSPVKDGDTYAVTVLTQPAGQTCSVSTGAGTVSGGNVSNVAVTCSANAYTVGGTLSGLNGTVVLQDNNGDDLGLSANGSFTFAGPVAYGSAYAVTVLTQPTGESCSIANGTGTMPAGNVTNVAITCAASTHTIGGTISGLSGSLVLQNNNADDYTVSVNGSFTFPTTTAWGNPYSVSILTQPAGQACSVSNAGGTTIGNVTNVAITCRWSSVWTWARGNKLFHQAGFYGTKGVPGAGSFPGARGLAVSGVDGSGKVWLFGGSGYDAVGASGQLNDLWQFDGAQWTWVSGANLVGQSGVYGTRGVAAPGNVPGARQDAVGWTGADGTFWLFGGWGYDSTGAAGHLNDLWQFDGSQWTWVSGSKVAGQPGVYGTRSQAAAANVPGARSKAVSWTDNHGTRWLFGGWGNDGSGAVGDLNDLWKFDGAQWTWVNGSDAIDQVGFYGTPGLAEAGNGPGGRDSATAWADGNGNLWLFGGYGNDAFGSIGDFNDLWKFDGTYWTWVSGDTYVDAPGVYGTRGLAAAANVPGARDAAVAWTDSSGTLWLSGGWARDAMGNWNNLNDLWKFDGSHWTWMSGGNVVDQLGVYGTQGVAAAGNVPGARAGGATWTDSSGKLWLFGGYGLDAYGNRGQLNELWNYQP